VKNSMEGRVVLVTGASRRVGAAIGRAASERGAAVVLHAHRNLSEARELAALLGNATAFQADLSDPAAGRKLVDDAVSWGGRLDVLVNNAAVFERLPFLEGDDETWERAWDNALALNLRAPARLARRAAPALRMTRGVIVNLVDIAVTQAWPSYAHYGAAKAGLAWLTKTLAVALAPDVRTVGIAPGIAAFPDDLDDDARKRLLGKVPLGRAGTPEDIAHAVFDLVSADYVNGAILPVDGGWSARGPAGGPWT
jgi:pteridine reductase